MINEIIIGCFAKSIAGHDTDNYYVIIQEDSEYVYLVDGRIRTLERPKKKKKKHVSILSEYDQSILNKVKNSSINNEEIKRAIKLLKS
ncbi:MAG: RNA-binding protein [Mobilitalea sp.]